MEVIHHYMVVFMEKGGLLAPVLFIGFHLLRPLLLLPVILICITGGILFGVMAGTIYSVIGITLSSVIFYKLIHKMPKTLQKLSAVKQKLVGEQNPTLTTAQIAILRLIPFIHFHILSLYIVEISNSYKEYIKTSLLSNIPFALIYTVLGQWLTQLSSLHVLILLLLLLLLFYLNRKKEWSMKWHEFFQMSTS